MVTPHTQHTSNAQHTTHNSNNTTPPHTPPTTNSHDTTSRAGLLYEDAIIETEEVKLALSRLPPNLLNAREQRLKRAMVLSSQYKEVSPDPPRPRGVPPTLRHIAHCQVDKRLTPIAHPFQLPPEIAEKIDPFESYLGPYLEQVEKEKVELLNK